MKDQTAFQKAVEEVKHLPAKPGNEELLRLYSLFKQATEGDVYGNRPGGFDFKEIAKYDAWAELKGLPKDEAADSYVNLVETLKTKYKGT